MTRIYKNFHHFWRDILQIWFSGYLEIVSLERRKQISPFSHLEKIKIVLKEFVKDFFKLFLRNKMPKNKIWFLSISSNNYLALEHIKNKTEESIFVTPYEFKKVKKIRYSLCFNRKFFFDIIFPINLILFKIKRGKGVIKFYDLFFKCNGIYSESYRILKKSKPKAIVFANDHEIIPRGVLLAAKSLNIPTFYIQHASISKYFPKLDFKYSLLEGQDSKDKYLKISNTDSKIFLVGMPKFDSFIDKVNEKLTTTVIGIAYNSMDQISHIQDCIIKLNMCFPKLRLKLRPHPSDKRIIEIEDVDISNPNLESAFEFLSQIDVLIAAESSIHLEAVMLNVYSISFSFNDSKFLDYYGFVEHGLITHIYKFDDLIEEIKRLSIYKPNIQYKAKYYNASLDSNFYGNSTTKILNILKSRV